MTLRLCYASLALVTLLGWTALSAEQAPPPARTQTQDAGARDSAVIGIVATDATGATPVARALVSLVKLDDQTRFAAVTDDEGKFAIRGIPAGRYSLEAEKSGHLTNAYGARRPGRSGITLPVSAGQQLQGLLVVLPIGAVISGRLVLDSGIPLRETEVVAISHQPGGTGPPGASGSQRFFSDDQGNYRIWGLQAGGYLVVALPQFGTGNVQRLTTEELDAIARASTTAIGSVSSAVGSPTAASSGAKRGRAGYGPTFYPSTPLASLATTLHVKAGDRIGGADITITPFRMSNLSGSVSDSNGKPIGQASINIDATGPIRAATSAIRRAPVRPDPNGQFRILDLPPGTYNVMATGVGSTWAVTTVQVLNEDVVGLALVLQPPRTMSGRVTTDELAVPARLDGTTVRLVSLEADRKTDPLPPPFGGDLSRSAPVQSDGSFVISAIRPGNYELKVDLPQPTRNVRSIEVNGLELRDAPLTFQDGNIAGVTVALTSKPAGVSGNLLATDGSPTSDYFVVLFPASLSLWHPASPRVQVTRPAADGKYEFKGILPGEYRIAAVTDLEDGEWRRVAFLETLREESLALVVREGNMVDLSLRVR